MERSESIAELSAALAKAQGLLEGAKKDSNNPFFKSKYADLASVWDACRKPLSDNNLSVVQLAGSSCENPEIITIETMLCHSSGEWISGALSVKPVKTDPQAIGSCITYLRRYSLQAIVGIAPEDDDGNEASGKDGKPETKQHLPTPPPKTQPRPIGPEKLSDAQRGKLWAMLKQKDGIQDSDAKDFMAWLTSQYESIQDGEKTYLTKKSATDIIGQFDKIFSDWIDSKMSDPGPIE